jgi:hypothetical protein
LQDRISTHICHPQLDWARRLSNHAHDAWQGGPLDE